MTDVISSILAINPDAQCQVSGENIDSIIWAEGTSVISKSDIEKKQKELQAEFDAQAYSRKREAEYPSSGDQMDMIYKDNKNSTTTHAAAVEAVKTKWPKDNSGPV